MLKRSNLSPNVTSCAKGHVNLRNSNEKRKNSEKLPMMRISYGFYDTGLSVGLTYQESTPYVVLT